jgi:hypothetical protein
MILHEAIEKLLKKSGQALTTQQIADELNANGWYKKKDGSLITAFQIHGRTKNYVQLFDRNGPSVSLVHGNIIEQGTAVNKKEQLKKQNSIRVNTTHKDEFYILDLCDDVLGIKASRQHRFDYLLGDVNLKGKAVKLPVDGYYEDLNLVIEYNERQHTEGVKFFDKPDTLTISGVHRGEQRKLYDKRKREILTSHNIKLIVISYLDFQHDSQKRLIRGPGDKAIVLLLLKSFLK